MIISPVAHQVDREFRVLEALGKTHFPVPKVYCLCEDDSIIGTSFYVCSSCGQLTESWLILATSEGDGVCER